MTKHDRCPDAHHHDQTASIDITACRAATLVKGVTLKVYPGLSHGMCSTNKNKINAALMVFIER